MAKDLRSFIDKNDGLILRVPKTVRREDLSVLITQANRPVLFEKIDGYDGWSVADLLFRDRIAQAAVLETGPGRVTEVLAERLALPPRAPSRVGTAPWKENIHKAGAFDLRRIPGFRHGTRDPCEALIVMNVCRAPDGGPANLSFTRLSPFEERRATMLIGSSPHQRAILEAWKARGEPMPMACVVGTHPAYEIMASYSVPDHLDRFGELDIVGNLIGETVETVACETVPLEVPAHAELVIEGYVHGDELREDGPGPSQALYYLPGATQQPVFEATMLAHRTGPILRQHNTLLYSDHQPLISLPHEALLLERLRAETADVRDVYYVPWGGTLACVVQVSPRADGEVRNLLMLVLGQRWPSCKLAIAVDEDVDIGTAEDLVWSLATRVDPTRDLFVVPDAKTHPIDPTARQTGDHPRDVVTGKWGIDATKPSLQHPEARARFERTVPPGFGEVSLADYL
jgi:2,5-furandicarboxylate decarboxylase 1